MADKTDIVLDAIKYVAEKTVENLNFDKTIICTVISNLGNGKYQVQEGDTKYYAYGTKDAYTSGDSVYVTIPQNDYNQQKLIAGFVVNSTGDDFNYIDPLNKYFQMTENLFIPADGQMPLCLLANNTVIDAKYNDTEAPLVLKINDTVPYNEYKFCDISVSDDTKYTNLAISADFQTNLGEVILGNYGLHFIVLTSQKDSLDNNKANTKTYNLYLDSSDMWGNPYNFLLYTTQNKLFELNADENVTEIIGYYYEKNNFYLTKSQKLSYNNNDTPTGIQDTNSLINYNIFINNINISMGYKSLDEESLILYTNDSLTYDYRLGNTITKTMKLRWNHLIDTTTKEAVAIMNYEQAEKYISNAIHVHWFQYILDERSDLGGVNWKEIEEAKDQFTYTISPLKSYKTDSYKAIIEIIDQTGLDEYISTTQDNITEYNNAIENYQSLIAANNLKIQEYENIDTEASTQKYVAVIQQLQDANDSYNKNIETEIIKVNHYTVSTSGYYNYIYCQTTDGNLFITFTNADEEATPDKEKIYIDGAQISCTDGGVYKFYDTLTNEATKSVASPKTATLEFLSKYLSVNSINGDITSLEWILPKGNTMIEPPAINVEYFYDENDNTKNDVFKEYDDHYSIIRYNPTLTPGSSEIYAEQTFTSTQYFRIRKDFHANYTNNIIKCIITRNEQQATVWKELEFGLNSTNGTNNSLILKMKTRTRSDGTLDNNPTCWVSNNTQSIALQAQLFDAESNLLVDTDDPDKQPYKIEWSALGHNQNKVQIANNILTCSSTPTTGILLKCEIQAENTAASTIMTFTSYLAIGLSSDENYYLYDGADRIIYNEAGSSPTYNKDVYRIYDKKNTGDGSNVSYSSILTYNSDTQYNKDDATYSEFPYIQDNALKARSMYFNDTDYDVYINIYSSGNLIWSQPVLIMMNAWGSSVLNEWDGSLTINEDEGSILSTMMGAGYKDNENKFYGVLMGKILGGSTASGTGIYGYHEGVQSYGFNINGNSFLGKTGKSQIKFNGNNGTIQNANYTNGTGIKINLNGDEDEKQSISIKNSGKEYIYIGSGSIGDGSQTYLRIKDKHSNTLLNIGEKSNGSSDYYLQSYNYIDNNDDYTDGAKIDLSAGKIRIKSKGGQAAYIVSGTSALSSGWLSRTDGGSALSPSEGQYYVVKTEGSYYNHVYYWKDGSYNYINSIDIDINSNATTYPISVSNKFKVNWNGEITSTAGKIGGWSIEENALHNGNKSVYLCSSPDDTYTYNLYGASIGGGKIEIGKNFSVDTSGNMTAKSVDVDEGDIDDCNIGSCDIDDCDIGSCDIDDCDIGDCTITGTLSSGIISGSKITGADLDIEHNGGYLKWASGQNHPSVSGLNVASAGIQINDGGLNANGEISTDSIVDSKYGYRYNGTSGFTSNFSFSAFTTIDWDNDTLGHVINLSASKSTLHITVKGGIITDMTVITDIS